MDRTPRLRSTFPETPKTTPGYQFKSSPLATPTPAQKRQSIIRKPVIDASPNIPSIFRRSQIPENLVDAPTQRFWAVSLYVACLAWKCYDWATSDGYSPADSTWLFMKWSLLDGMFFTALPLLQIPWLEWSFGTFVLVWLAHAAGNFWFMFNFSIPWVGLLTYFGRMVYNKELSLSDTRVDPGHLVDQSEIILGKQIINLLPEGSAILNPAQLSYCLNENTRIVNIPIQINQTTPDSIELLRYDLETDEVETILIGSKQAKKLKNEADRSFDKADVSTPRTLQYPVSKKGLYRLQRVIDKSKLEVRRRSNDVAVVACPRASVSAAAPDRCTGDLSGISLHVTGVPPFQVKYSKQINHSKFSSITQTVQPSEAEDSGIVLNPKRPHMGWTQSKTLSFEINESLAQNGTWMYSIEEVTDGLKNKVIFDTESTKKSLAVKHLQAITVHKRPVVKLHGCDAEHYLRVAREDTVRMPLHIAPRGELPLSDWPLRMKYTYTAESEEVAAIEEFTLDVKDDKDLPAISKAGRYEVVAIESQFCSGEVKEPSSCLLYNPPRPSLAYQIEEIFDKCAGRPIGAIVNFDFTGTPPFKVRYEVTKAGAGTVPKVAEFKGMRGQLEIRERSAGSYKYRFNSISDEVYSPITIRSDENTFEQNIRPPAEAFFQSEPTNKPYCLGAPVPINVKLLGEGPWTLYYELVHAGKRTKFTAHSDSDTLVIEVPPQKEGGKYIMVLTGVQDSSKCRTALKEERHVDIRPEQPRVGFGTINSKRFVEALESKQVKMPLQLKGLAPWTVKVQNERGEREHVFNDANSYIIADIAGLHQIVSVSDSCPGIVDPKADKFEISWIKRPGLSIQDSTVTDQGKRIFLKQAVCQGEGDSLSLVLSGHSPYHIKYSVKAEPARGQMAISNKPLSIANNYAAINMDTSKAGHYTYTFNELADDRYTDNKKHFLPLTVKQEVYALPSAQFASAGRTYGFCKDESDSPSETEHENIPITLTGVPPFSIDIAVRHHGKAKFEPSVKVREILSTSYSWSLSRASLPLGTHHIQIKGIKDGRGCETIIDNPSTISVRVSAPPRIVPLDTRTDYCVGDHLAFSLSGQAPFDIFYKFHGKERKANIKGNEFRRISDHAGEFVITAIQDSVTVAGSASKCKAAQDIRKTVHPFPTVRLSHGKTLTTDIHEGGEVELVFQFTGTPPFEFTYIRSENAKSVKGRQPRVLETKSDTSVDFVKVVRARDEGTYEVVSIRDAHCAYAAPGLAKMKTEGSQKLLM
ncbi:hypothetical protein LTS08_007244 [Lithohypha guttulata]|uniref:Nucleoporin Pom152 n=1 Tax=Lithohypha guttulata TaxID=1690604 RepID=A0AAN7T0V8_9EURO|nr:hypothetical protein LTR05_003999 [Lithohypha guttulata]KAK5097223.1 hypothetical protein LTS08_007244 [Lithohypha guttulata]